MKSSTDVFVIREIEGGSVLPDAFLDEQDAWSHLYWEEAEGKVRQGDFTVSKVTIKPR